MSSIAPSKTERMGNPAEFDWVRMNYAVPGGISELRRRGKRKGRNVRGAPDVSFILRAFQSERDRTRLGKARIARIEAAVVTQREGGLVDTVGHVVTLL